MDFCEFFKTFFKKCGFKFKLYGSYLNDDEVFAETGLITAIVRRADMRCNVCYGYGLGVSFSKDDCAILGERVSFDEATPNALRLMFIYDAVLELKSDEVKEEGVTEIILDDILYSI